MTDQPSHFGEANVQTRTLKRTTPERKLKATVQPLRTGETDVQIETFKKMTPEQKLKAAMRLYWSARRLKTAWIRQQHPEWTKEQVEQTVKEAFVNART